MKLKLKDFEHRRFEHSSGGMRQVRFFQFANINIRIIFNEVTNKYSYSVTERAAWLAMTWQERKAQFHPCESWEDALQKINKILEEKRL